MAELTDEEKQGFVESILNADTIMDTSKLHANTLVNVYKDRVFGGKKVNQEYLAALVSDFALDAVEGKFAKFELLLAGQVIVLDAIFTDMAVKMGNSDDVKTIEGLARVVLKAQDNTRKTILSLYEMKNPKPTTFIKQQMNQSLGHMQVNNSDKSEDLEKSQNLQKNKNELLEQQHGERLDFGKTQATSRTNQAMAAVGKIHGTED